MIRRRACALALALAVLPIVAPGAAHAAEYAMTSSVSYVVDPAARQVIVTVEVTFTNTTPNASGQLSAFDRIDLAIQAGATEVGARDAKGPLTVDLAARDGALVASVRSRTRVRYNQSVSFTLSYRLVDGVARDAHVRSEVVKFPAWGFGTSSQVTVELPGSYVARADGDPMVIEADGALVRLTSGPIPDPDRWLALVTAARPAAYLTHAATVALASGTVDLQVRAWSDDGPWGEGTLAMLAAGLPKLEEAIGLPYPRVGPLVVTEAVGGEGSSGVQSSPAAEIQVAFDASAFTLLHQAAHIWINGQLAADRWIREGLASHEAARVAVELAVARPYDPGVRSTALAADAVPLIGWGAPPATAARDAYAYAASWAFVDRIATHVGEAHLLTALRRVVAGTSAYDPAGPDPLPPAGLGFTPVDTRRLLDQLAAASGVDLATLFGEVVFDAGAAPELAKRELARAAYDRLVTAAGDWGAPVPVRAAMADWQFDAAGAAMEAAAAWLVQRDALLATAASAGLTVPGQLRERYAAVGGGEDARAELAAEVAVADAYLGLQRRAVAPRGPLEAIGLFAADDPRQLLVEAATEFAAGDLIAAAKAVGGAELQLDRAPANGAVRIASAVVLLVVILLLANRSVRRRGGSHYTAAP